MSEDKNTKNEELDNMCKPQVALSGKADSTSKLLTVFKDLQNIGLTRNESSILLYLTTCGERSTMTIAQSLHLTRLQTYRTLQKLMDRGLVQTTMERPRRYFSVGIEQALDLLTEDLKKKAQEMEMKRPLLIKLWSGIASKGEKRPPSAYRVIQKRDNILRFKRGIIESAKKEICMMTTRNGIMRWVTSDMVDYLSEGHIKRGVAIRIIAEIDEQNIEAANKLLKLGKLRHLHSNVARLTLVDNEQLVTYLASEDNFDHHADNEVALWTNNVYFVRMMKEFFEISWKAAIGGHQRSAELKIQDVIPEELGYPMSPIS